MFWENATRVIEDQIPDAVIAALPRDVAEGFFRKAAVPVVLVEVAGDGFNQQMPDGTKVPFNPPSTEASASVERKIADAIRQAADWVVEANNYSLEIVRLAYQCEAVADEFYSPPRREPFPFVWMPRPQA